MLRLGPLAALTLAVALAGTAAGCSSSSPSKADQASSAARAAGLSREVADLVARVVTGPTGTYVVSYDTNAADGTPRQLTVSQRGVDTRLDTYLPDGSIESTIRVGGRTYQCSRAAGSPADSTASTDSTASSSSGAASGPGTWQCAALPDQPPAGGGPEGVLDPATLRAAVESLTQRAADFDFRIETRTIAGTTATCLVTTPKAAAGTPATLCLAPTNAQLLVEVPRGRLEAKDYRTEVDGAAFTLPAPVTPPPVPLTSTSGG